MLYEKSFKYIFSIVLPIAVGGFLLSERIIQFVYGKEFLGAAIVLRILLFEMLLVFLTFLNTHSLNSMKLEKKALYAIASATVLNILLNLVFIPLYGAVGGAITSVVSEAFLLGVQLFILLKVIGVVNFPKLIAKPLAASVLMTVFVYLFFGLNLFLLVFLGAVVFFGLMYLIKGFTQEDIKLFKKILGWSS
jgi:O-antigen/teichoic acid export membrane protein